MTEDQIKAIAEEVAHLRAFDGGYFPHEKEIREDYEVLLRWLNEKYCIVEREKVMNEIIKANQNIDLFNLFPTVKTANVGVKKVLTRLFDTSMFNQNKE